jgi:hypothetical protein
MGEKADKLNQELVPTRSLLRWLADAVGVTIDETLTAANYEVYRAKLSSVLVNTLEDAGVPPRAAAHAVRTRSFEIAAVEDGEPASGALVHRPDIAEQLTDQVADTSSWIQGIAKELGLNAEGLDERTVLASIHAEILSIKATGGDVEIPKGDTLAQAVKFGHDQNHELRDRVAKAELLIQRMAGALQVTVAKDSDGSELMEALQRIEVAKVMMRRRILELRATNKALHGAGFYGSDLADELETEFQRLLSPSEMSEWAKSKGVARPSVPELAPHPFVFTRDDLARIASCVSNVSMSGSISMQEMVRRNDLAHLMSEIASSPTARPHFLASMEATLAILARERAAKTKE